MTEFKQQNTNQTTRIHGKMYYDAYEHGWMSSLAYFVYLSHKFPYKYFKVEETGIKKSILYTHLAILEEKGFLSYKNGYIKLISNSGIRKKYNFSGSFSLYTRERDIRGIKKFLKSVPILSNLYNQKKQISKKQDFRTTYDYLKSSPDAKISKRKYEALTKFMLKNDMFISPIRISLNSISSKIGCSKATSVAIRKYLKEEKYISYERQWERIVQHANRAMYKQELQDSDVFLFYRKRSIYKEVCPAICLPITVSVSVGSNLGFSLGS